MPRRKDDDVTFYWYEKQKEALLRCLADYNKIHSPRQPDKDNWAQWAEELSPMFSSPIPPHRVKEAKERMKRKFNSEYALRTNTGLGWDPVKNEPTCTPEYWDEFEKTHGWAKNAREHLLPNYDLYYEAFAARRAVGAFATGMEHSVPENDDDEPNAETADIFGSSSQPVGADAGFVASMQGALNSTTRALHVASSSRPITKRPSRSSGRGMDPVAKNILEKIQTTLESRERSRETSSGATQPAVTQRSTLDQCQEIINEMLLDDEQIVSFTEYLTLNPHFQSMFLGLKETSRLVYVLKTLKSLSNQGNTPYQPQFPPFMNPHAPFSTSQTYSMPSQPNYSQHPPTFHPQVPNSHPPPPFQRNGTPQPPIYPQSTPYWMPAQFPNYQGHTGGEGSDDQP